MIEASRPLPELVRVLDAVGLLDSTLGRLEVEVAGVSQDSRSVGVGDLFLAWEGTRHDAHDYVSDAADSGAVAAVVERPVAGVDVAQLVVTDGRRGAALAADWFFGAPGAELDVVGVTGTNGKTTTVMLTRHVVSLGAPTAAIGTLGVAGTDGAIRPGSEGLTTPGPVELERWLATLRDEGILRVVVEASSHALDQRRVDGVRFDVAVFTNFSRDHLDYHADADGYFAAKARLLELLAPEPEAVVVNADDPAWDELPPHPAPLVTFSASGEGDVRAEGVEAYRGGVRFRLVAGDVGHPVDLPLVGRFNVENALAAAAAATALGREPREVATALSAAPQVPGRLERVSDEPCPVFIDFAHTPAALERAILTLRPLAPGRLVVVFGAGGDRDRGKRPEMGRVVAELADLPVVTSDNPRTEDPGAIVDDILAGMEGSPCERIVDRREAIGRALELARPDDLVLLAGKGHETYQVVGEEKRPFDERAVVRELLRGEGSGPDADGPGNPGGPGGGRAPEHDAGEGGRRVPVE